MYRARQLVTGHQDECVGTRELTSGLWELL